MADLSITATAVLKGSGATINPYKVWGETVTAGQGVYLAADDKWYKGISDAVNGSALKSGSGGIGIALNGGVAGQPAFVQTAGEYTVGATILVGVFYYLSNTAGGICPVADLGTGDWVTPLFYGLTTTTAMIAPVPTGKILA